ncbi:MAG: WYL domain-containing protein [Aminobacterium colombiense]|mgnify:CR=1 FL=1|nr:WYL domain-containing protein [Aminobacterium colombiense]
MPRDLSSVRLSRLNNLVLAFYSTPRMSKREIITRLEYSSDRTFERDLAYLRDEYAVDISYNRNTSQYVFYGRGKFLVSTALTEREVTSMAAGLKMAAHFLPHLEDACTELWGKLKGVLPEDIPEKGEQLALSTVVALPVSFMDSAVFETLFNAIQEKKTVRLRYCSPYGDGAPREHEICPWGMYFRAHAWYLWAWSCSKNSPMTLRIGRISSIVAYGTPPYVEPPENFDVGDYASSAWYGCTGEGIHDVSLKIEPPLAAVVAETTWHPTQKIEENEDGSIILSATVPNLGDVARWVMASAPYAKALEPTELKSQLYELGTSIVNSHS